MAPPEEWVPPFKFYVHMFLYSIQRIFYLLFEIIINPEKFKKVQKIVVPPKCLYSEENGVHHYAKLAHTKFHYVDKGDPTQPLLLLIHGYPEFWYSWRFQLRSLSAHYWVVALDLKGYGDSDKPSSQSEYDITLLVEEIRDFLTAVGKEKCTIVTHGFGGLVGWYFLHEHPELIENFVSIASAHPISFMQELNAGRANYKSWYYFTPIPYLPEKETMKDDLKVFNTMFARMMANRRGNFSKEDLEAYKYTFSRYQDWVGPINYFRTLLLRQRNYTKTLKKSHVRVLFIIGNSDPYCSLEMICKSSEYVENFTLKIVEGGGHFLNQEMPNYVNSLILDFLKKPELASQDSDDDDRSILRKVLGAGKTVMTSTVNQVWSTSKDAVAKGLYS